MKRIQSVVRMAFLIYLLNGGAYAKESTDRSGYIMAQMPKLKITQGWLVEKCSVVIPKDLYGQTVSIIRPSADKTFLLTAAGDIVQVDGKIEGNYCEYESHYDRQGRDSLKNTFLFKPSNIRPFQSLNLPPPYPFQGPIPLNANMGRTSYIIQRGNACVYVDYNNVQWSKKIKHLDLEGNGTAIFTIQITMSNRSKAAFGNLKARIYLQDRYGNKYYPISDKPEQFFDITEFNRGQDFQTVIRVEAPADEFSLCPVIEYDTVRVVHHAYVFGYRDWEQDALNRFEYLDPTVETIVPNLINCLKYTSTSNGYDRVLSKISFVWLRLGRYADALSILNTLLNEKMPSVTGQNVPLKSFLLHQQLYCLIRMHEYESAAHALLSANENEIPKEYCDYLTRNCLRQIEIEADLERAKAKLAELGIAIDEARNFSRERFDALVFVSPYSEDTRSMEKLANMKTIQGRYDEAVSRYHSGQFDGAIPLLKNLAGESPREQVTYESSSFKVVPAALDLLGRSYWKKGDVPHALACFKQMEQFPNDTIIGPVYGEGAYGGPAGAEGMHMQIQVLTSSHSSSTQEDLNSNREAAIAVAHSLINKYRGITFLCWEGCSTYDEIGAYYITECLTEMKAPLARQEEEIRWIAKVSKNDRLSAKELLHLAKRIMVAGDAAGADRIYSEVIEKYSSLMPSDDPYEDFQVYSLDAYLGLLDIAKKQKDVERYDTLKLQAIEIYNRMEKKCLMEKDVDHIRELEKRYGQIGKK